MGKRKLMLFAIIVAIFFLSGCTKNLFSKDDKKVRLLSDAAWKEDIDVVYKTLIENHPVLTFNSNNTDELKVKIDKLKSKVSDLSDAEIRLRLVQDVASLKDGHTQLFYYLNQDLFYPLRLWWFGDELRVIDAQDKYKDIIGFKVTEVNKMPIRDVINKIDTLVAQENNQWPKNYNISLFHADVFKFLNISDENEVNFTFVDDNGDKKDIIISPGYYEDIDSYTLLNYKNLPRENDNKKEPYWYKYVPEEKLFYFNYNECLDRETVKRNNEDVYKNIDYTLYGDFNDFIEKINKDIEKLNVEKLVIDMRGNGGGDYNLFRELLNNLANNVNWNENINKKGHLFVLVDRKVYSSAIKNAVDLKYLTNAIIIGEPTGGNVDTIYGFPRSLILPNSQMLLYCATQKTSTFETKYKGSLIPDILIEQTFEDYKKGIDDVYEAVINYEN